MKGHSKGIGCMIIDRKESRLFSGGLDGTILVWDAKVPADAKAGVEKGPLAILKGKDSVSAYLTF
jgi:WD40 repeat protein